MTKNESILQMQNGKRVKHYLFSEGEFIYMKNGLIYDENDYLMECKDAHGNNIDFCTDRKDEKWDEGWSIFITDAEKLLFANRDNSTDYTPAYVVNHINEIYLPKSSHKRTNKKRK